MCKLAITTCRHNVLFKINRIVAELLYLLYALVCSCCVELMTKKMNNDLYIPSLYIERLEIIFTQRILFKSADALCNILSKRNANIRVSVAFVYVLWKWTCGLTFYGKEENEWFLSCINLYLSILKPRRDT